MERKDEVENTLIHPKLGHKHQRLRPALLTVVAHLAQDHFLGFGEAPVPLDEQHRVTEVDEVLHHLLVFDLEVEELVQQGLSFKPNSLPVGTCYHRC